MFKIWGWSLWAVVPIFGLAFHFGPGQNLWKRDLAVDQLQVARQSEVEADKLQEIAYQAQFATLAARQLSLQSDSEEHRRELERLQQAEQQAYSAASDAWKATADRYQQVETLLGESPEANRVRWLRGRALVRAGEIFNGIEELQATYDQALAAQSTGTAAKREQSQALLMAAREELAAAHYYGARLLREEGRAADVWRKVSETSRQQFRFLAEQSTSQSSGQSKEPGAPSPTPTSQSSSTTPTTPAAQNLQRNLERVLDLEQQDRSELIGRPIPKESPRARRPGDGEPGKRPGVGPPKGDQPNRGASDMMEIGDGW